jgi:hypothetical protein
LLRGYAGLNCVLELVPISSAVALREEKSKEVSARQFCRRISEKTGKSGTTGGNLPLKIAREDGLSGLDLAGHAGIAACKRWCSVLIRTLWRSWHDSSFGTMVTHADVFAQERNSRRDNKSNLP